MDNIADPNLSQTLSSADLDDTKTGEASHHQFGAVLKNAKLNEDHGNLPLL